MKAILEEIVTNLEARSTQIDGINLLLRRLVEAYRIRFNEQNDAIVVATPDAKGYAVLFDELSATATLIGTLIQASEDLGVLQTRADRILDKVYKKLNIPPTEPTV